MRILRKVIFILYLCTSCITFAESNTINALIIENAVPFNFRDEYGNVAGFDVDLISRIAKNNNLNITYSTESLNNILTQITNHDGDIALLPLSVTEDRKKKMIFSDAYVTAPTAMVYTDNTLKISELSDIKDKKVIVLKGNPFIEEIEKYGPAELLYADTNFIMYRAI